MRKLLKRFDPIERILNQVQQLLDSGNLDLAREVIEKARQTYPQQPAINLCYAKIHGALEEFGEAAESLERVASQPLGRWFQLLLRSGSVALNDRQGT